MTETQMVEAFGHRVIKGSSSTSGNCRDLFFEIVRTVGERFSAEDLEPDVVVEVDDEHFILRITGMSEGGNGSDNPCELRTHAAAVVDDQADGYGSIFLLEESELLRTAILEHGEVRESQSRDDISLCVRHAYRKCNER